MCWTEYLTRYYGCGATTPDFAAAPGIQQISARTTTTCYHMRRLTQLYQQTFPNHAMSTTVPDMDVWARDQNYTVCRGSTYWASWNTTRHCRSDALHGNSTCTQVGVPHAYPRAWSRTLSFWRKSQDIDGKGNSGEAWRWWQIRVVDGVRAYLQVQFFSLTIYEEFSETYLSI